MQKVEIENVRCFSTRQSAPLRPLTLLVGENSTGKSTFLAMTRIAADLAQSKPPDFNEEPFHLGGYDQIATYRGGSVGRAREFYVSQLLDPPQPYHRTFTIRDGRPGPPLDQHEIDAPIWLEASFIADRGQPTVKALTVRLNDYRVEIAQPEGAVSVTAFTPKRVRAIESDIVSRGSFGGYIDWHWLQFTLGGHLGREVEGFDSYETTTLGYLLGRVAESSFDNVPFAPIRPEFRRIYTPTKEFRDPSGTHIPMALTRLLDRSSHSQSISEMIHAFGESSGLFTSLAVRRFGTNDGDPFQIEVKPAAGPARNLVDVGYGVSQVIPILVDALEASSREMLLIQQPEIHLHPRAQAEMGTLLAQLAAHHTAPILVETHSDYLVDRVRIEVRDGALDPSKVALLYFQNTARNGVEIHPINISERGELEGVPRGFRDFFLREERRFLQL